MIRPKLRLAQLCSLLLLASFFIGASSASATGQGSSADGNSDLHPASRPLPLTPDLQPKAARVSHLEDLDLLVFEMEVRGKAGRTVPESRGQVDGAPVLGYVFPTTLASQDVGFAQVEGTVALAVTSHPDFDDTPLWDENGNRRYDDDGVVFHSHWVVLVPDDRVAGGLAVRQLDENDIATALPPTNPGMPMYMDSPGFSVLTQGRTLKVLVPAARVAKRTDFRFDGVSAFMRVNTSGEGPMLGVYEVYGVLSGDLSLPYRVKSR